jgi:Ca2+-binding RTX toxin-like protein
MVSFIVSDLQFILDQIKIAEANAQGEDLSTLLPNAQVPWGLRTVDGSFNNLINPEYGAADEPFTRLTTPVFGTAEAPPPGFGPPGAPATSYSQTSGSVFDSEPRTISNLIVDQTDNNPAAVAARNQTPNSGSIMSPGLDGIFGTADDKQVNFIPNETADGGLSAPFNAWMTFFGQFFDHGLDLVTKGGSGTIFIPLKPDDPLYNPATPQTNFMVLSRATNLPGPDGILGNADDIHGQQNTTTPFVDQNQTYSSHPSHQVFLREYRLDASGHPVATGGLIENRDLGADGKFGTADDVHIGGMATWAVVKAQARDILGINLTDANVFDVPLLATDAYGNFLKGPNGMPLVMMKGGDGVSDTADDFLVEGNRTTPISLANAVGTGHQFLIDVAHGADPTDSTGADADNAIGGETVNPATGKNVFYDNELLDAHYIAGDGRVNENIGLTAVHAVFHSEHNRLVQQSKDVLLGSGNLAFLNEWLLSPVSIFPTTQAAIDALQWNGERLFQAARFGTEMQYQHLVFEEFARTVQPQIDEFLAPNGYDTTINPAIVAEFAHTVYRFGHSMLTETVDRYDADFNVVGDPNSSDPDQQLGLIAAFLNPLAYAASGATPEGATGAIVRGLTRTVGNEIDEFVTEALRNNLVGLPLDLAALNIARGRDTGIPTLNAARREFFAATGDNQLAAYTSWADFAAHLKHPESLINFIAAYGTHSTVTGATTLAGKRAAATLIVLGGAGEPADRLAFLNSTGATWGNFANGVTKTGLDDVDFWIGGLAEAKMPFGGMLGSSFNFVFETQLESLQNGDRFYYLARTAGLNFGTELENNSFAKLVMANSDVTHLSNTIFTTPAFTLEVDPTKQLTGLGPDGKADPTHDIGTDPIDMLTPLVIRDVPNHFLQYTGEDHVVLGGTSFNDTIISSEGDDTLYGDAGNDKLEGGYGNDAVLGGAGDDIITDRGGDNRMEGNDGNDVISVGKMSVGGNLILGGAGKDFIITTEDISTTFGGTGDDFILGAKTNLPPTGNEGDDWIEWGTQDGAPGDDFSPVLADDVIGNDIFVGGGGFDEMIGEGGDDIFVGSDAQDNMDGMSGFDWVTYKNDLYGVTVDLSLASLAQPHGNTPNANTGPFSPVAASPASILDRFAEVEGLSGSKYADILHGDDVDATTILDHAGATGSALTNVALINGLQQLLASAGLPTTGFATGNIILGGDGSDVIEGRGGDDLIDGDAWLNVRISVRQNLDGTGPEIASFNSMKDMIPFMMNGTYNPGQLVAVRELVDDNDKFDTAVFSGAQANYTVTNLGGGTWRVTDNVGDDGTDTLRHVERLQFADGNRILVPGLNQEPVGRPSIRDAGTDAPDSTPVIGQLLEVSMAAVTDGDNPGAITQSVSYYWQVERTPGTGVFEDIILLPAGDLAFLSADGTQFRVTPDLAGLALRVKAIYEDAHGVTEVVFSNPTSAVGGVAPPVAPPAPVVGDTVAGGEGIHFARSDLNFILDQIRIAEKNAAGEDILSLIPNVRAALGLRTVDGSYNNLVQLNGIDHTGFGAADGIFPRLSAPVFGTAEPSVFGPPGGPATSYSQTSGSVFDSEPRTISNLIVDQTDNNPAAVAARNQTPNSGSIMSPGLDGIFGTTDDKQVNFIPNEAPDVGLSAPFNAWMTFFGQFFDHGLDLVTKGGSGTIFIPLKPDDPLFVPGSPSNFMVLTRATNLPGPDSILGTADDIHEQQNTTTPFVDQNQTYSSHPSHQVFLREYRLDASGHPVATGDLIENRDLGADGKFGTADDVHIGGMATWAVVKAQARDVLGINLTDANVFNVPLLATDAYGNFIKGPNGMPMVMMKGGDGIADTGDDVLVEGNLLAPISLANAVTTGHQFLIDVAHNADPSGGLPADSDSVAGNAVAFNPTTGANLEYDNELLDAHYMAGDGRVNENIGLTAVHAIFHSEHNRLIDQTKQMALDSHDVAFLNEWLLGPGVTTFPTTPAAIDALQWNGERLFQAARFGTEMQYQHLVFEEFSRTIQPNVDLFFAPTQVYDVELDPAIVAEFAHTVYRFGHSMLTETVDRYDADFNVVGDPNSSDPDQQLGLIAAFLNPLAYAASGDTPEGATAAIVRGLTRTVGNEIDEFVTEALRNNLVGLPLDLAAINIARGRDVGIPTLNAFRRDVFSKTGDTDMKAYTSWADFVQHLKHPESLINFIAAYGTHSTITSATNLADKRAAATLIVLGGAGEPADRLDFLNSTGATWGNFANGVTKTGLDDVDFWIGGLAEAKMPFGGMLGSSFNFVFENQLEALQDGDRFYYLERTSGLSFNAELESNSFAKLIMANTSAIHLPALVFSTPAFTLEVDQSRQFTGLGDDGRDDPTGDDPLVPLVIRNNPATVGPDTNFLHYTGEDHVVLGGTNGNDIILSGEGDDTVWGDGGNDRIDGGDGNDQLRGGAGDDIITDLGGDDNIQGGDGNDVIDGGNGVNLLIGGFGNDFIITGEDASEAIGGQGNDFILGSKANEQDMGNEGDDWIEKGTSDGAPGDNFDPLGNDPIIGNDVFIGDGENDKFNGEGGDDIMMGGAGLGNRYIGGSGFDWATFKGDADGVYIDISDRFFDVPPVPGSGASALARFDFVEGLSGSEMADVINGDDSDAAALATAGATGSVLNQISLIDGMQSFLNDLLGGPVTSFDGGNIILGGDGSDRIMGRGGNDLIDGDAYLNVRISVRQNADGTGPEIATFDSLVPLAPLMVNGTYTPGQLKIVREIVYASGPDFDTAVFGGNIADYTIVQDTQGTANTSDDVYTVTDNVGTDGTDSLRHVERLQFADGAIVLSGANVGPAGEVSILDKVTQGADGTPALGQVLQASIAGVVDGDNLGGTIAGPVAYFWQADGGTGVFDDILIISAGEVARVEGPTFTPTADLVGQSLRIRAVYKDANGVLEEVYSAPTQPVDVTPSAPTITSIVENGGGGISALEASNGTPVAVNFAGTGVVIGDSIVINWGGVSFTRALTGPEITAGTATVIVPAGTIATHGDGTFNVTARLTNPQGNEGPHSAAISVRVDTTADAAPAATVTFADPLISSSEVTSVSFTVSGIDLDATATVTFAVGATNVSVAATNGVHVVNLSSLGQGTVTTSLAITDTIGNSATVLGGTTLKNTTTSLTLTVAQYFALGTGQLSDFTLVTIADTGAALTALTAAQIAAAAADGVDVLSATSGSFELTRAEFLALGAMTVNGADVVLADSGSQIQLLTVAEISSLATKGVDRIDSTNNIVTLTVAQALALGTVALTPADVVTLADAGAAISALTSVQIAALAAKGFDGIDATDNVLSLNVAQALALGAMTLAAPDVVTLTDTGAAIAALTSVQIAALATNGVDRIDATGDALTLNVGQALALGAITFIAADNVTLADTGAAIATLTGAQIAALAIKGVDVIDATDDVLTLTTSQATSLGTINLTASDFVTVADTGAALTALTTTPLAAFASKGVDQLLVTSGTFVLTRAEFLALGSIQLNGTDVVLGDLSTLLQALTLAQLTSLAGQGVDRIDATDNVLLLSVAQVVALGTVALTAGDVVTLTDTGANLAGLTAVQIGALSTKGVDRFDATDNVLALKVDQAVALGSITLTAADVVTLTDTGAALATLTGAQLGALATKGVDRIDATDNALSLNVSQAVALGTIALTAADVVTLADTGAAIATLTGTQIATLATKGVDIIDASDNTLTLDAGRALALAQSTIALTVADLVTVADTGAVMTGLTAAQITSLATKGFDQLSATSGSFELTRTKFLALGAMTLSGADVVLVTAAGQIALLTAAEITAFGTKGGDRIDSSNDILSLTVAQAQALAQGPVTLTAADLVTLTDTGAAIATLTSAEIAALAVKGLDRINATDNVLSLTVSQASALGTIGLTAADVVTLSDTGAAIAALTGAQIAALATSGIDTINASDNALTLDVGRALALAQSTIVLTAADLNTVADTGAAMTGLTAAQITSFAAKGFDQLSATSGSFELTRAKFLALGAMTLSGADVVLATTVGQIPLFTAAEITAFGTKGGDRIDSSNDALTLTVIQAQALAQGPVTLTAADLVALADTGAAIAGLSAAQIAALAVKGLDRINATDDVLSLTVAQYQALGTVSLVAADVVTLADTGAAIAALSASAIAALAANGIDRIDATDNTLILDISQFSALGTTIVANADALTVIGTPAADTFDFALQTFTGNDSVVGGLGTDRLRLDGDYSAGLTFGAGAFSSIETITTRAGNSFSLTTNDANVAAGASLSIVGSALVAGNSLTFDGSAETDGRFVFTGGAGANTFTGGDRGDNVTAGGDVDTFRYTAVSQSTSTGYDTLIGVNFGQDFFDVAGSVTAVRTASGALNGASFDTLLTTGLNGILGGHEAALFTATSSSLSGATFLVVDQNNVGGYQAGSDLVIRLNGATGTLTAGLGGNFL